MRNDPWLERIIRENPGLPTEMYSELHRMEQLEEEIKYQIAVRKFEKKKQAELIKAAYKKALKGEKP